MTEHHSGGGMTILRKFTDEDAVEVARTGGKGANLGVLTQSGFTVPPGFVVTTDGYLEFLRESGVKSTIESALATTDFGNPEMLNAACEGIQTLLCQATVPTALAAAISDAYGELAHPFVAVRSSGVKEDTADASYAGLHDTFLDIEGADAVIDAVKRCWASLWSARATAYRDLRGIDHFASPIAVVVQAMVQPEVAGVLFTANPLTTATDELVVNASFGLGEAVVAGIVTPDQYVVKAQDLSIREKVVGSKEIKVVRRNTVTEQVSVHDRDAEAADGTITLAVPDVDRARFALSDHQIIALADLGRRVQAHYEDIPQDIEWAYIDGEFYLLQSRPITGVELSWDIDLDDYWRSTAHDDTYIWSRGMADQVWTGPITPLMYSWRAPSWVAGHEPAARVWGHDDLATMPFWKFHKAQAYYNSSIEKGIVERTMHPALRPFYADWINGMLPPQWRDEAMACKLSILDLVKMHARIAALFPNFREGYRIHERYMTDPAIRKAAIGADSETLGRLSDNELIAFINDRIEWEDRYNKDQWSLFFIYFRDSMALLPYLVFTLYKGGDPLAAVSTLMTGTPERTKTVEANHILWDLARTISESPALLAAFRNNENDAFLEACSQFEEGRAYLERYRAFLADHGHRGHADRDIYFPRRFEDASLDYNAIKAMLGGAFDGTGAITQDPAVKEEEANRAREVTYAAVVADIRERPFGFILAELFKFTADIVHKNLMMRDNERWSIDFATTAIRRGVLEMNKRLIDRELVDSDRDVWMLSVGELYDLVRGRANMRLTKAKIAGRMRDFDRMLHHTRVSPVWIQGGQVLDYDAPEHEGRVLKGMGTAGGVAAGRARVARSLNDIGKIKEGEILIVNATDPGWTPIFNVVSGIVLETGGMIAHGACLAREYGLPAVQIANATRLIDEGLLIEVNGDTGQVLLPEDDTLIEAVEDNEERSPAPAPVA
jgi:rifampicin phosphotransferase